MSSPFITSFAFRFFTSMFGVFALIRMLPLLKSWFHSEKNQKLAWALLKFSWFVPYIQTRTTAESFGISFLMWGMSFFLRSDSKSLIKNSFIAGVLFGFSYLSRSQMSFSVAFLWFWGVFISKKDKMALAATSFVIILMICLCVVFDRWGDGEWTFSTCHYFRVTFLEGLVKTGDLYP